MVALLQSILLLFYIRIAKGCTQLANNELVLVNKINETQSMDVQQLFIKQEQFQIVLVGNDSDINIQQYLYTHSNQKYSFNNIVSVKYLRSYRDYSAVNQYVLLNKFNDQYEIHTNSYQIEYNQRLPVFKLNFVISNQTCYDIEIMNRQTIIVDCFNESSNVFILQNETSKIQYFTQNSTQDFKIKRKIFAFQDKILIRVFYYDEDYKQSSIQFIQIGETIQSIFEIDDKYINERLNDTKVMIELQIVQVQVEQQIITILNKNQWVILINAQEFPLILIEQYFKINLELPVVFLAYHIQYQYFAFLTQQKIYIVNGDFETQENIKNKEEQSKIYFTEKSLILQNKEELNLLQFNLKNLEIIQIDSNSKLIMDQTQDEIIIFNEQESRRIIIRMNRQLYFKSNYLYQQVRQASLIQSINSSESCTLKIRYMTIALNSTEAIPTVMNQFNTILNSQIESYEVQRFIDGPNITFYNINKFNVNQVQFSINFEQLQQKTISGIISETSPQYIKIINVATTYLYFVQSSNLYVQFYYCVTDMICTYASQIFLEFNLSQVQHEFFIYGYIVFIVVKNNQQLDVWKVSESLIYQCTIYPDQDHQIIQFQYINQFLAVLYSNQLVVIYKIVDQCQKSQTFTTEYMSNFNISWNPTYIQTNDYHKLLYVQTGIQLLLISMQEKDIYPINIITLNYNKSITIFSFQDIIWIYYKDTTIIESFKITSLTYIQYQSTISLYNVIPNKFYHNQQASYVYFQNSQDSLGSIYVYCMECSSHNALLTTFQTKYKLLYPVSNLFIIADINHYFEVPKLIKYSIYYQDIDNPNYLIKVNTFLTVSSYDNKDQYKYLVNSTLVNPYTTITVNKTQLNLEELLTQGRPIGYCQSKYSWYTGQVVDITLKSAQLKLRKSMHLLEKEVCSSGLDIKEYISDSVLILHDDKIVKLNMTTKLQQIYFLDTNITYIKIISIYEELIFISSYTITPKFSYLIQIIQCDKDFKCLKKYDCLNQNADPKTIQVLYNLYFIISDISIDVYSFKDDRISYIHNFNYSQQGYFQAIISPEQNYFQIFSKQSNKITISMYQLKENQFLLIQQAEIDLLVVIQQTGFYIDPKTLFYRVLIKKSKAQQQLFTAELFCQSYKHSHYILQIQSICKITQNLYQCAINNYKILQILQGYGTWPSSQVRIYKDQYLFMNYYQTTTYISAVYSLQLSYVHPTNSSTLFSGAIQYQNVSVSQQAFFTQESQIYLLTNAINKELFALFEIHNTTKFCIYDHLRSEQIQITLKNNFHEKNDTIEINQNSDIDDNKSLQFIIWLVFGIVLVFLLGMLLFGCYVKYKKRQSENQLIL
ncbi:unnamed protein product [Paramecium sonneborni]|uniref:Transmembrane protein n=1 Tax=Paramecium sonneborni TaxID=65129 RepID=A0A8S1PGN0_9CILI|nr:unnamed protein product [Paramecium sonneborni]